MFGIRRRKKIKSNPDHYPLDTVRNFYNFIVDRPDFTDAELTDIILRTASKIVWTMDIVDLVKVTRDSIGYYKQKGNQI